MRKILIATGVIALVLAAHPAARADTLSDWIAVLFGITVSDNGNGPGAQPDDGPGSGTAIAD